MFEPGIMFYLLPILVLFTVLLVFGMKYFSATRQVQARADGEASFREFAAKAEKAQASLQADISDMKTRLIAIEKVLRDVG